MKAAQYNEMMNLLAMAIEDYELLSSEIRVLNRHACDPDAEVVLRELGKIHRSIDKAVELLNEIGKETVKKVFDE